MAIGTSGRFWFFNFKHLVTSIALLVISPLDSRSENVSSIKRFAVATAAPGRLLV